MRFIFCIIVVFLLKTFPVFAQPKDLGYEPPAGWAYIMNLDSTSDHYLHAHNDTIVLRARDIRRNILGENRRFSLYSLNGGTTWDTLPLVKETGGLVLLYDEDFFPNSNRLFRIVQKQGPVPDTDTIYMKISDDLGKSWTVYNYGESSQMFLGNIYSVYFHPLDPNTGFWISGSSEVMFVYRTHDGGRSWKPLQLPPPADGRGRFYQILPDVRNPKVWNVLVNGQNHTEITDYYQTRDDGKTFKRIRQWGEYAGIAYEGEVRSWWKNHYYTTIGIVSSGDQGDSVKIPWLKRKAPEKPDPDFDNGYYYSIAEDDYVFLNLTPDTSTVVAFETKFQKPSDSIEFINSYIYHTYNDGETWENIWPSDISGQSLYLDQGTHRLWLITYDYKGGKFNNPPYPPLFSLYRQEIPTSVIDNLKNNIIENITISPNPAENQARIEYTNTISGKVEMNLYDILGTKIRTIYSGTQEAGEQKLIWNIPAEIPSGTYFLKLESGRQSASQKLVITR